MDMTEKEQQIHQAITFFNLLFGKIKAEIFSYLMTFTEGYGVTYSFAINDKTNRINMAKKAIELSALGNNVWHAVNPVNVKPTGGKRGDEKTVSFQTAVVIDIDICSDAHKSDNLAQSFDEAKSFLPFPPSIIINSGYGLHAYYIWEEPIAITDANREKIKRRNNLFIEVVRQRAHGKKIDGVGDLPRILRTPYTRNYKLGKENAPLCQIVEINDIRFLPDDMDERLNALYVEKPSESKSTHSADFSFSNDDSDLKRFRIERMLDHINVVDGEYEKWLSVGMALKNEGFDCSLWEQWSRTQPDFKEGECESKWSGFNRSGYGIGTLYQYAIEGSYDEKETQREFFQLQSNPSSKQNSSTTLDKLKVQLRENAKAQTNFDAQKKAALQLLCNLETFDSKTVFSDEVLTAGAFAYLFDRQAYSNFKRELKLYGDNHKTEKATVNDWIAAVKDKANEISSQQSEIKTRKNQIQAQIHSLSFIAENEFENSFVFPEGYSVSAQGGIVKVDGEKIITVCRRPIVITGKTFSVEDKTYKVILSYMNSSGKWKTLPATSAAIIANKNKIIDLAELGLPVTSSNATHLVDFLDAFNAQNEKICNMTYTVPRCGWYRFNDTDFFIDPRRECIMTDDDKKVNVRVDSQSQFANSLKQRGSIKVWKRAYELAKKSPVARIILAASIASILLKILGERNFLLYIHAPTRAGKTTALYLGASAIGNDKMIRSFDATKNGLAGAAADVNDYAFLVDEKQVADNRLKEAFDNLVYALANGLGRTKLNKDSTLRKLADWRTIVIMTGETQLLADNVTGGANTRLLSIAAPKEILSPDDCKTIRDIIKDHHGLAFPLVIDKILELGKEKLCAIYEDIVETFVKANPNLLNEYCRYMAVIVLADALLCTALANDESKDTQENFALLLDDAKLCAKEIFKLIPTTTEISDTARERDFVLGFIAQNQNRFIGGSVALEKILTVCGQFTDEYIYITVAALKKACDEEGFDYRKLATDLVAAGFFVPSNKVEKGYKTQQAFVQKKIGKANTRCYRIRTVDVQ